MARGSVTKVQRTGRNGKPYTRYRAVVPLGADPATGKRRQATAYHDTSRAAWGWVRDRLAQAPNGLPPAYARMTVGALLDRWLAIHARAVAPNTMYGVAWAAGRARADLGDVPVADLSVVRVQEFYDRLETVPGTSGRPLSPASIKRVHSALTQALDLAVDWELIARNPAKPTRRPAPKKAPAAYWRPATVKDFLAHTRDDFDGPLWALILATGMRIGEAVALDWSDIDLDAGRLTVNRTMTRTARGVEVLGATTKTKSSRRTLVLPLPAQAALRRQQKAQEARRRAVGELWVEEGAVFDRGDGRRRHMNSARDRFKRIVRDRGLPALTPHGLRDTCATYLFELRVPVKLIADLLGHASVQITQDLYIHVSDEDRGEVARAIEAALGGEALDREPPTPIVPAQSRESRSAD